MRNCFGLGNLVTKKLSDLIGAKDLSVVFIVETWADIARLKEIKRIILFDGMFLFQDFIGEVVL